MPKLGQTGDLPQPPRGFSAATQALLAGRKGPVCKACNDTGVSSRGGHCYPCLENGRIQLEGKE